jgi:hypothetical protein
MPEIKKDWPTDCRSQFNFNFNMFLSFVNSEVMLRPTVSRQIYISFKHPSEAQDQISITVDVCVYVILYMD